MLVVFVVFYGLDWVATVPPTVALRREAFGTERAGVVFAWVFSAHQIGAAGAAWGAGLSRGWFDSYLPAFLFAGSLGIAGAVISLLVGRRIVWREPSPVSVRPGHSDRRPACLSHPLLVRLASHASCQRTPDARH